MPRNAPAESAEPPREREPWFAVRRPLSARRSLALTVASFSLPLLIWCAVSYLPFLWHPDVRLHLSADREGIATVYTAGDRVRRGYFDTFQEAIREQNARIEAEAVPGAEPDPSLRRANQKILRQIAPPLVANGWLSADQARDDAAIFDAWGRLARGEGQLSRPRLSEENLVVVQRNWELLSAVSETYAPAALEAGPLLSLVPQGRPANPDYLPEPHQVLLTGIRDFTARPEGDRPSMMQRAAHSVRIVFSGFLLAAAIAVPIGVLCGTYAVFSKLFEPFTDFFRYLPAPTFSTLLVAIFLANDGPKVAMVFVGTFFQLVLVVANTTRRLELPLLEAAQTLGANQFQLLTRVVVPGILPNLYNDLRILLGWAWTWLVIAELVGVKSGLTEFIETQGRWRNFDSVFPVIIAIGLIGFFTDQLLALLRRVIFPWTGEGSNHRGSRVARAIVGAPGRAIATVQRRLANGGVAIAPASRPEKP
jgi:NitT/TauT family transport system permease protein